MSYFKRVFLPVGIQQIDVQRLVLLRKGKNKLMAGKFLRQLFYYFYKLLIEPSVKFKFSAILFPLLLLRATVDYSKYAGKLTSYVIGLPCSVPKAV